MDGDAYIALGAVAIAAIALLDRLFGRSLSRAEHIEFKEGLEAQIKSLNHRIDLIEYKCRGIIPPSSK